MLGTKRYPVGGQYPVHVPRAAFVTVPEVGGGSDGNGRSASLPSASAKETGWQFDRVASGRAATIVPGGGGRAGARSPGKDAALAASLPLRKGYDVGISPCGRRTKTPASSSAPAPASGTYRPGRPATAPASPSSACPRPARTRAGSSGSAPR